MITEKEAFISKIEEILDYQPGKTYEDLDIQYDFCLDPETGIKYTSMNVASTRDIQLWNAYADYAKDGIEPERPFKGWLQGLERFFDNFKNGRDFHFKMK